MPLKSNKKRRIVTISCILFCVSFWWSVRDSEPSLESRKRLSRRKFALQIRRGRALRAHKLLYTWTIRQTNKGCHSAPLICLVERTGFEPVTPTLPVLCAPNCANAPSIGHRYFIILCYKCQEFFAGKWKIRLLFLYKKCLPQHDKHFGWKIIPLQQPLLCLQLQHQREFLRFLRLQMRG